MLTFHKENNKYILYILELLNNILDEDKRIYGYQNNNDQRELALINFNNIINISDLSISKIVSIKNKDTENSLIFPMNKSIYNNIKIVVYMNNKISTDPKIMYNDCTIKTRMMMMDNYHAIYYQNFDDNTIIEIYDRYIIRNIHGDEFNDYFKNKYIKYKNKYLYLVNKLNYI
jgi:hypothetical protein